MPTVTSNRTEYATFVAKDSVEHHRGQAGVGTGTERFAEQRGAIAAVAAEQPQPVAGDDRDEAVSRRASGRLLNLYAGRNDRVRACHSQRLPCPSRDGNRAVDRLPFEYRESPERTTIAYVSFCRVSRSLRGGPPIAGGCTGASRFPTHFAERVRRASRCTLRRGLATAYRAGLGRRSRSERKQRYATSPPGFVRRPRMGRFWSAAASLARLKRWQGWRTSETWS